MAGKSITEMRRRIPALDSLRGLAALGVVVFHCTGGLVHRIVPAGQLVALFFVLSGFVLTLGPVKAGLNDYGWLAYQASRLTRLLPPIVVAVVLCYLASTCFVLSGVGSGAVSGIVPSTGGLREWSHGLLQQLDVLSMSTAGVRADGTVVPMMDLPVWSMCWELLFSLLLPLYVLLARDVRVVVPSMLAIMVFAQWSGWLPLQHMAVFAIGVALAYHHVSGRGADMHGGWSVIACLACVAMMVQSGFSPLPSWLSEPLGVAGAAGLVYVATGDNVVSRLLSCRPLTHLGAISFSLYLTHLPVRDLLGQFVHVPGRGPVLMLVMLAVAEVFYRLVEKPSTVLSHRVRESCMPLR